MTLAIRRYRPSDLDAVRTLHRVALAGVGIRPGDGVYYDDDIPAIEDVYLDGHGDFLVGEVAGRIIAMGGLRRVDGETAEMCRLRVHPDHQGRGHGAAMLEALQHRAVELGYRRLRADTTTKQRVALALYRRYGWRETRREPVGDTEVVYLESPVCRPQKVNVSAASSTDRLTARWP